MAELTQEQLHDLARSVLPVPGLRLSGVAVP